MIASDDRLPFCEHVNYVRLCSARESDTMESPPSSFTWSEHVHLSDDSGLMLTSSSSGIASAGSHQNQVLKGSQLQDSDCEDKTLSQADSLDGMSDIICCENFNTLKKGNHWLDLMEEKQAAPIDPPLEFQDKPSAFVYEHLADMLMQKVIREGIRLYCKSLFNSVIQLSSTNAMAHSFISIPSSSFWSAEYPSFASPYSSRRSLGSSRLSSSHNSLTVPTANKVDDSSFITQAVSHDTLSFAQINDVYNVPFDSDIYSVPKDTIKSKGRPKMISLHRKRRRTTSCSCQRYDCNGTTCQQTGCTRKPSVNYYNSLPKYDGVVSKRHNIASSSHVNDESLHMTLQEVRQYLQSLYCDSSSSNLYKKNDAQPAKSISNKSNSNHRPYSEVEWEGVMKMNSFHQYKKDASTHSRETKENCTSQQEKTKPKKSSLRIFSLKQAICNIFRFRRFISPVSGKPTRRKYENGTFNEKMIIDKEDQKPVINRALPPLPPRMQLMDDTQAVDFAKSLQKVKDYGWYWGPISGEAAEKILSNEPDGSFIVRDSSDDHYIFSLTFKLNNSVRHVRIEHFQGNFSFGTCTKFKSQTIVEFIENAVEHSRSGRYLFFLHRRPVMGPVRVQLLHPVSRFKQIQSLQHMCRFVILKIVRKDLISELPLPRRMIDYLSTPQYYSEHFTDLDDCENEFPADPTFSYALSRANTIRDSNYVQDTTDNDPVI